MLLKILSVSFLFFFQTYLFAQSLSGFELNQCEQDKFFDHPVYNSCIKDWKNAHGNVGFSVLHENKKLVLELPKQSGIFSNFNFKQCNFYRLILELNTNEISFVSVSLTSDLVNSTQEKRQISNEQKLISNKKASDNFFIIDSITPFQDFIQLLIENIDETNSVHIKGLYLQPFCIDSIIVNDTIFKHPFVTAQIIKIGTKNQNNSLKYANNHTQFFASDYIEILPGFEVNPGAVLEAFIQPCKIDNSTCVNEFPEEFPITIYNLITPTKDNKNDFWYIDKIENYDNTVEVFDQLGNMVFKKTNYRNDWSPDDLGSGTYFYKVFLVTQNKKFTGSLVIQK